MNGAGLLHGWQALSHSDHDLVFSGNGAGCGTWAPSFAVQVFQALGRMLIPGGGVCVQHWSGFVLMPLGWDLRAGWRRKSEMSPRNSEVSKFVILEAKEKKNGKSVVRSQN